MTAHLKAGSTNFVTPRIFFSDLASGPNTGGENGGGAYVTIYGTGFGATQGTSFVTVGGGQVANYKSWGTPYLGYQKISFQLGPNARSGNIVVNAPNGSSNGVPFVVRPGNIYFVGTGGSNSNPGTSPSAPWADIYYAASNIQAGDTVYFLDAYKVTGYDPTFGTQFRSSVLFCGSTSGCGSRSIAQGTASSPIALVAYPGATVIVGSLTGPNFGFRFYGDGHADYWVVAGFTLRGNAVALGNDGIDHFRFVGNDLACTDPGQEEAGCLKTDGVTVQWVYGNNIHDVGGTQKLNAAVYFGSNTNEVDYGWNTMANAAVTNGIEVHSTSGVAEWDYHIHDSVFHDIRAVGVNFAAVDPNHTCSGDCFFGGGIEAYNNVMYSVGIGPNYSGGGVYQMACFYSAGILDTGNPGSGTIQIYNNTTYSCGGGNVPGAATGSVYAIDQGGGANITVSLRNNVFSQLSGENYFAPGTLTGHITGANNLYFGAGTAPLQTIGNISADPLFVNASVHEAASRDRWKFSEDFQERASGRYRYAA